MSARPMPRWMRAAQKRILAKPGIAPELICPECHRSMYASDWSVRAGTCVDCATPRPPMYDCPEGEKPFLPEED